MVATSDGSETGIATCALEAIMYVEVTDIYVGAVGQEVECVFGVCTPGHLWFASSRLWSYSIRASNSVAMLFCVFSG